MDEREREQEIAVRRGGAAPGTDEALTDRVAELEALVARMAARQEELEAQLAPPVTPAPEAPAPTTTADAVGDEPALDRRSLLGSAGRVAAGAIAGGAALALTQAQPAAAASGTFDGNPAVTATNTGGAVGTAVNAVGGTGIGVNATGAVAGVYSSSTTGPGVNAFTSGTNLTGGSAGVIGTGNASFGVLGFSANSVGGGFRGARADLVLGLPGVNPGPPSSRDHTKGHSAGELVLDVEARDLWLCVGPVGAGQQGTWQKLGGEMAAGAFHVLPTTKRIFDSRVGFPPANPNKGTFVNEQRVIAATFNSSGVPVGASAVLVNLAVTSTNSGGFGALFENGTAWPGNASINWGVANTTISNLAVVSVDASASFLCKIAGSADVIIDAIGYYR